ncbi:cell surface protein [Crenalkalicoccus roseus]|uniref:cell surface protein n=1 Tax=Crenalkalicoccus roseus TaxID=1485588 RepID=UPI0010803DC9|nr:cell surface protein [Crenalkalicoccus roseus]
MDQPQTRVAQPLRYLDKALGALRELGLPLPEPGAQESPVTALLARLGDLDQERVVLIARVLNQASTFHEVVREQVRGMQIADRYQAITDAFNSIRDDARAMVRQVEDGRISTMERLANIWQKATRGDIADRFQRIRDTYLEVSRDTRDQVEREHRILEAYRDFRGALKEAEVLAFEVLRTAEGKLAEARAKVEEASRAVETAGAVEPAERARLELARDEAVRALQAEEGRYQIAKDLSDNLTVSYNTSEVIMARLVQTTSAKERVWQQSVSFFSTNEAVLTALTASFTGLTGLAESTRTLEGMKEGVSRSLETLAEIGGQVQDAALRAGYGPTIRADAVRKLVDSVVSYQEHAREIIEEMRESATRNSEEIRRSVEDAKRRMARLAQDAARAAAPVAEAAPGHA